MSEMAYNNQQGQLGASLSAAIAGTSQVVPGFFTVAPNFQTLTGGAWIKIELDPGLPTYEILYLTAYTAGSLDGTFTRAAEDASNWPAAAHNPGAIWVVAPTVSDVTASRPPNGSAGGDLGGSFPSPTVMKIAGSPLGTTTGAANGQALAWNGSAWVPTTISGSGFSLARASVVTSTPGSPIGINTLVPVDSTSGAITIPLPIAPADKTIVAVKLLAGTNPITLSCGGSDVLEKTGGSTTSSILLTGEAKLLEYTASGAIWTTFATDTPLSQLDLRYVPLSAINRTATASVTAGEASIFTGSTASQTLTLPASGTAGSVNTLLNLSSVTVTLAAAGGATLNLAGTTGSIVVPVHGAIQCVLQGTTWYVTDTNIDAGDVTGTPDARVVGKLKGMPIGTISGATSGQALTWNGSAWVPQTPSGGGSSVPTPTGSGEVPLSSGTSWGLATAVGIDTVDTPLAATKLGTPGSGPAAAAQGHAHPLSLLGRGTEFGFPPGYSNLDFTFDGSWNGGEATFPYGYLGTNNWAWWTLVGSTYTSSGLIAQCLFFGRNLTIASGITLKPQNASGPLILVASESITINGTINCAGAAASGTTPGGGVAAGGVSGSGMWRGAVGGTPTTGAGGSGAGTSNNVACAGGLGGTGGGGTGGTGGGGGGGISPFRGDIEWLLGNTNYYMSTSMFGTAPTPVMGGTGGGAGAGDGTNLGGAGGAGGGVIILLAPQITIGATAVLNVQGGAGGAAAAGNANGGAGGGGGLVSLQALAISVAGGATFQTAGGAGGAAHGTGAAGAAGGASTYADPATGVGGFGLGAGVLACQWQ